MESLKLGTELSDFNATPNKKGNIKKSGSNDYKEEFENESI